MRKNSRGVLFILSGPSGAGKGTLRTRLFKKLDGLKFSVSCTTRGPRCGERDGVDYHFISDEEFRSRVEAGDFLEWAFVHGHYYGTLKSDVEKVLEEGFDIFLEIDVQGALQVKEKMPEAVTVFVVPPSIEVLERRLRGRGSESEEELRLRLDNAQREMEQRDLYDFVLVNDDLDDAVEKFAQFVVQHRQTTCEIFKEMQINEFSQTR